MRWCAKTWGVGQLREHQAHTHRAGKEENNELGKTPAGRNTRSTSAPFDAANELGGMDDEDEYADIFENPVIIIDCGAREWRCGWSDEEGPGVVLPGAVAAANGDQTKVLSNFRAAFEALEVDDASDFAILISEQPGTTPMQREVVVDALFNEHRVRALFIAAAPLLTLYNTSTETGVVVDVGERTTFILPLYDGHLVAPAATAHPIAGGHMPDSAEAGGARAATASSLGPRRAAKERARARRRDPPHGEPRGRLV